MKTAIFVDGGFFLKRLEFLYKNNPKVNLNDAKSIVKELLEICYKHLKEKDSKGRYQKCHELYRIFFYDCPPLSKKVHRPITKKAYDFAKSPHAVLRNQIHQELRKARKMALRFGRLQDIGSWAINKEVLKDLLARKKDFSTLTDDDFYYEHRQKSVDMKLGIDIASVSYKKQVERIVLIAGDSDFVPAAKLARREGIDFILDPMFQNVAPDLFEHIDGLKSTCVKREPKEQQAEQEN